MFSLYWGSRLTAERLGRKDEAVRGYKGKKQKAGGVGFREGLVLSAVATVSGDESVHLSTQANPACDKKSSF